MFSTPYGGDDLLVWQANLFQNDGDQLPGVVLRAGGELLLSGENDDYLEVAHNADLELANGTVSLRFTADEVVGWQALFSKDASGQDQGGHLTAYLAEGRIRVRLQREGLGEQWLYTADDTIVAGQEYHVAVTFGAEGFWLYLDGQMADWETRFTQGLADNTQPLAIGASLAHRSSSNPTDARNEFDGVIRDFTIYDSQFTRRQVARVAGVVV